MHGHPQETTLLSLAATMPKRPERRDDGREQSLLRIGCLLFEDRRELCLIRNISAGGALVRTYSQFSTGRSVAIEVTQGESVAGVVRWCDGRMMGIMFNQLVDVVQLLADSADWPRPRQPRVEISAPVWLEQQGQIIIGEAIDLSQGGLKIRSRTALRSVGVVRVDLRGLPPLQGTCRWASTDTYGLEFRDPLPLKTLVRWVREHQAMTHARKSIASAAA